MSARVLVFIESNTTGTGRLFVRAAREMGFRPVLVTARPLRYAYLADSDAPEVLIVDDLDEANLAALLADRFNAGRDIAGITSSSEYFAATAAALAARFCLPGPDAASIRAARSKAWQREMLAAAGLPTPAFRVVGTDAEAARAARDIGLPVVLKPLRSSGSMGVRACATAADASRHAATLLQQTVPGEERAVLVESLIDGPEFSVEVFSGRVVGITRKHLGPAPCFVETGHDYPARLPSAQARILTHVVTRATAHLGLGWGPLHWELRIRDGRPFPIEVNPRLAGGFIPVLVREAQGIDLIAETLRLVAGQPYCLEPSRHEQASIRFLVPPHAGRLLAAEGCDEARAIDGVQDVALYRATGDQLTVDGDFRDRIGHVIARARHAGDAARAAEQGRDAICLRVEHAHDREAPFAIAAVPHRA